MIEIYFVLYLSALILVLQDEESEKEELNQTVPFSLESGFNLRLEKTTLSCRILIDSDGRRIVDLDSVNKIFYYGEVKEVEFEFSVENPELSREVRFASDNPEFRGVFRMSRDMEKQSATFFWNPSVDEISPKTYTVKVKANAMALSENGKVLGPVSAYAKFGLNVIIDRMIPRNDFPVAATDQVNIDSIDSNQMADQFQRAIIDEVMSSDVNLYSGSDVIRSVAGTKWTNQVWVTGGLNLKRDIKQFPELELDNDPNENGGSARIASRGDDQIQIEGITPSAGSSKVRVSFVRKYDGTMFAVEFLVKPQLIQQPDYASVVFPGTKYKISPNLPFMPDQESKAVLKFGSKILASRQAGNSIEYAPNEEMAGKTLVLERIVNNKLHDSFSINVKENPPPEIVRFVPIGSNAVRVVTRSHGWIDGSPNDVKLEITSGNAKWNYKVGSTKETSSDDFHTQHFDVVPQKPDQPFQFSLRAIDKHGKSSQIRSFPK